MNDGTKDFRVQLPALNSSKYEFKIMAGFFHYSVHFRVCVELSLELECFLIWHLSVKWHSKR